MNSSPAPLFLFARPATTRRRANHESKLLAAERISDPLVRRVYSAAHLDVPAGEPMRFNAPARFIVPVALATAFATPIHAQPTLAGSPSSATSAAKADPRGKKVLGLADIGRWKRINAPRCPPTAHG